MELEARAHPRQSIEALGHCPREFVGACQLLLLQAFFLVLRAYLEWRQLFGLVFAGRQDHLGLEAIGDSRLESLEEAVDGAILPIDGGAGRDEGPERARAGEQGIEREQAAEGMAVKRLALLVDPGPAGDPRLQLILDEGQEIPCPAGPDFWCAFIEGGIGLARRRTEVP